MIVNEERGVTKYIKADDPVFKLQSWDALLISVFAVDFDKKANPLRDSPDGQVKKVTVPGGVYFRPVETNGEWLKVRWELESEKSTTGRSESNGWIRWKHDGVLLIQLLYFS